MDKIRNVHSARCKQCNAWVVRPRIALSLFSYRSGWHRWGIICASCARPFTWSAVTRVEVVQ